MLENQREFMYQNVPTRMVAMDTAAQDEAHIDSSLADSNDELPTRPMGVGTGLCRTSARSVHLEAG